MKVWSSKNTKLWDRTWEPQITSVLVVMEESWNCKATVSAYQADEFLKINGWFLLVCTQNVGTTSPYRKLLTGCDTSILILMLHILFKSANETIGERIGDYYPVCHNVSVSRNTMKRFTAHRPEETICCLQAWSIRCFRFYSLWLEAGGDVYGWNGFVQISVMCLSLSSKTNARVREDLYDRKQYHFCPHMALQSAQIEFSSEALNQLCSSFLHLSSCSFLNWVLFLLTFFRNKEVLQLCRFVF